MLKRVIAIIMVISLCLGNNVSIFASEYGDIGQTVSESGTEASGTCGKSVTWLLKEGTLTISGEGEMDCWGNPYRA